MFPWEYYKLRNLLVPYKADFARCLCTANLTFDLLFSGLLWKIYSGFKKSTRQEAAIFVFEKKQLEKWPKTDRDLLLDMLRRGISQLTRLRHPQILVVHHPLEESR